MAESSSYAIHIVGRKSDNCTIKLEGTNIVSTAENTYNADCYAVKADCNLTITGDEDATLTATGGKAPNDSHGIYSKNNITVNSGSITATGGESANNSFGVFAENDITVNGGTITGRGGKAKTLSSYGVSAGKNITAYGGSITGRGGESTNNTSFGVCAGGGQCHVTVSGGNLTGIGEQGGGAGSNNSYGIYTTALDVTSGRLVCESQITGRPLLLKPSSIPDVCYWRTGKNDDYTTGPLPDTFQTGKTYVDIRSGLITFTDQPDASKSFVEGNITGSLTAAAGTPPDDPDPTLNWFACDAYGNISGNSLREGGTFTIPTDLSAGTYYYRCQASCLNVKINSDMTTVTVTTPVHTDYEITQGRHGEWIKGSGAGLRFTANADYTKFNGVSVDGTALTNGDYTSQSGSTIVTLNAAYLETLSMGRHSLRIDCTDGHAETDFLITVAGGPGTGGAGDNVPRTGDGAQPMLWLGIALLACAGLAASVGIRRKRQKG